MSKRIFPFVWNPFHKGSSKDDGSYTRNGYDLCVHCRKVTRYTTETPIQSRMGYIEGAGQLCENCMVEKKE